MKKTIMDNPGNSMSLLMHEQENLSHIRHLLLIKPSIDNRLPKFFIKQNYKQEKTAAILFLSKKETPNVRTDRLHKLLQCRILLQTIQQTMQAENMMLLDKILKIKQATKGIVFDISTERPVSPEKK